MNLFEIKYIFQGKLLFKQHKTEVVDDNFDAFIMKVFRDRHMNNIFDRYHCFILENCFTGCSFKEFPFLESNKIDIKDLLHIFFSKYRIDTIEILGACSTHVTFLCASSLIVLLIKSIEKLNIDVFESNLNASELNFIIHVGKEFDVLEIEDYFSAKDREEIFNLFEILGEIRYIDINYEDVEIKNILDFFPGLRYLTLNNLTDICVDSCQERYIKFPDKFPENLLFLSINQKFHTKESLDMLNESKILVHYTNSMHSIIHREDIVTEKKPTEFYLPPSHTIHVISKYFMKKRKLNA